MSLPTSEINKALSYCENFTVVGKSRAQLDHEWLISHYDWILSHSMIYIHELDLSDPIANTFVNLQSINNHLSQLRVHLKFLTKLYDIITNICPPFKILPKSRLLLHDGSKKTVLEVVGYTEKWVIGSETKLFWKAALNHHLHSNPHHTSTFFKFFKGPVPQVFIVESILDGISRKAEKHPFMTFKELFDLRQEEAWLSSFDVGEGNTESEVAISFFKMVAEQIQHLPLKDTYFDK